MIYLFHGDDIMASEEALQQLLAEAVPPETLDLALTRLEGGTLNVAGLIEHCEALPFLSPRRIIVVEGLAARVDSKKQDQPAAFLQQLRDYLPRMAGTTILVLRERTALARKHPLVALVKKVGEVREFAPPRGRELARWIAQQAQREGCEITPAAAGLLAATAGADVAMLRQEVAKLATYVGAQGRIDERLVAELAFSAHLSDIFALVDAIGQRRRAQAMVELRRLLQNGQHPLYILTMVVRQFRLLLQVKALPAGDRRPNVAARILRMHPYVAGKVVSQSKSFRRPELERIHHRLVEVEQEIKTGKRDGEVALELIVVEVAGR